MGYLEIIENNSHIINFGYNCGRGSFTLDLNNAVEMFSISDFKRFFSIAAESPDGSFAIAEKVQEFTAARLEYEKSFLGGTFSKNQKLIAKLEKILVFLSDSFGLSCDIEKPEKIAKKKGNGLLFFSIYSCNPVEIASGTFCKISDIWFFVSKNKKIKKGGYTITVPAYGSSVGTMYNSEKSAIEWIISSGISDILKNPEAGRREKLQSIREKFLKVVENIGFSWVIESNPAYFEDFLTTAEAETPAAGAEMPQKAIESTTEANSESEKEEEKTENAPTECAAPAETPAEAKKPVYIYGMRLRGVSVGCQPLKFVAWFDDPSCRYHDIIVYNRPLSSEEMQHYSLDDMTGKIEIPASIHITKAVPGYETRADFPTITTAEAHETPAETITSGTGCAKPADSTTARRAALIDRRARHKPHIPPKMPRGYISTIDGTKAGHGAKYAPTMARHTPPISIGFQKMDFPVLKNGCFNQKGKIAWFSVKNRFGFCIGVSPPGGY